MSSFNNPQSRKQNAKSFTSEGEFRLAAAEQLAYSKNGSPRWRLTVIDPQNDVARVLVTAPGASSAYSQRMGAGCVGEYFRIAFRSTPSGRLLATSWRSCPATFKEWMVENLTPEDLDVLRNYGASAGVSGLIHYADTLPLYERYRYSDLGDVAIEEGLLDAKVAYDARDMQQLEHALVWMVAELYARGDELAQAFQQRAPRT